MAVRRASEALAEPRWDGRRVLLEAAHGGRRVACTISQNALQDLGGRRRFGPSELLLRFAAARARIEAIAPAKPRAGPEGASGLLHIWSDAVDDDPGPQAGSRAREEQTP